MSICGLLAWPWDGLVVPSCGCPPTVRVMERLGGPFFRGMVVLPHGHIHIGVLWLWDAQVVPSRGHVPSGVAWL